ncbi:YdgA family protein [bacterium]|nr:YdgA family protein [bacterium]MBU1959134.1 YdgA family protein [bacterium]
MKKIFGSLIAVVAIWVGSTALIGSQTEQELQNYIEKTNRLYASNGLQFKLTDYQKSFLNSTAQVSIDITDPSLVELLSESYDLPFKIDYNIEHGPLFFQNGLGLGLSKVHHEVALSSLFKGKDKKEFLDLLKEDVTIKSEIIISFLKNANYLMSSDPIQIKEGEDHVEIAPLSLTGSTNLDTFKGKGSLSIPHLLFKKEGTENQLKVDNLVMDIEINEFIDNALMLGTFDLAIGNLLIKDDSDPELKNINLKSTLHMVTTKDSEKSINTQLEGDIDFLDTQLPADFPNLKTIHAKLGAAYIGIDGMIKFQKATQEMQKAQTELITKMQNHPEEIERIFEEFGQLQENMMGKIVQALNTLLIKDKTLLNYAFDAQTKDNKTSSASAEVGYTGDMKFDGNLKEIALKAQRELLTMIQLHLNINVDAQHIKALPDAETLTQQIQMAVVQGFVKEENGKYILNGSYKNQELMVNDNNLTASVLPLLMMATQGGM